MKGFTKWIFIYVIVALCLILSAHTQPTKQQSLMKRAGESDVNELHQATLTRSETATQTTKRPTATATSTQRGDDSKDEDNEKPMPAIIQADSAGWWSKLTLIK
jgi:hypothetical protein